MLNLALVVILTGCATMNQTRQDKIAEYKLITKDVCVENANEVRLAQHLYNSMINN